jgi:transposase
MFVPFGVSFWKAPEGGQMSQAEIVTRRRKWRPEEKAALLAEVEAEGGRVSVVARRHGISDSLIYNWRSAWQAAASMRAPDAVKFVPLGVVGRAGEEVPAMLPAPDRAAPPGETRRSRTCLIEIELPNGIRIRVDAFVNENALSRILQVMKGSM